MSISTAAVLTQMPKRRDFLRTITGSLGPLMAMTTSSGSGGAGASRFTAPNTRISDPSKVAVIAT